MRVLALLLMFALLFQSAPPPTLHIFTANNLGRADLLPGDTVEVVIELRSEARQTARVSHSAPEDLTLERASVSAGSLAIYDMEPPTLPVPGILWTGEVSSTQPINIVLTYRVLPNAIPGDRRITATGRSGGVALAADSVLRVCCISAPPAERHDWRMYLVVIRR